MCCQNFILNFLSGKRICLFESITIYLHYRLIQHAKYFLSVDFCFQISFSLSCWKEIEGIFSGTSEIKYNETQPLCKLHWQGSEMRWHTNQAQSCRCYYSISISRVISWIKQCLCKSCNTQIFHTEEYV